MYRHQRLARKVDADTTGVYTGDRNLLASIDDATADTITLRGGLATAKKLSIKPNQADSYPTIDYETDRMYVRFNLAGQTLFIMHQTTVGLRLSNSGVIFMTETTTPTAIANMGAIYTKNDNKLYFQDGAGVEHTVAFV